MDLRDPDVYAALTPDELTIARQICWLNSNEWPDDLPQPIGGVTHAAVMAAFRRVSRELPYAKWITVWNIERDEREAAIAKRNTAQLLGDRSRPRVLVSLSDRT